MLVKNRMTPEVVTLHRRAADFGRELILLFSVTHLCHYEG